MVSQSPANMTNADVHPNVHRSQSRNKDNIGRYHAADDHAMQIDQGGGEAGPTATPFLYSGSMHADLDAEPLPYPQKRPGFFASLVCCCTVTSSADQQHQHYNSSGRSAVSTPYAVPSSRPPLSGTPVSITTSSSASDPTQAKPLATPGNVPPAQQIVPRLNSGVPIHIRRTIGTCHSEAVTEYGDATSYFSGDLDDQRDDVDGLDDITHQLQPGIPRAPSVTPPWVPDPPLYFAESSLQFVPVPAVTGFAAYWANIHERTTPFPQPIDIMIRANWLVKKVHKSIPGIWMRETENQLTVAGNPSFTPPNYRAYCEVYDKSNETEPTWTPRRDMQLGHCSGKIYFTSGGTMILRAKAWTWPGNKVQYITEDYATLEDDGQVIVNKMWCLEVETGRTASQYMVGSRHDKPPRGWT
eukprot:GHUV01000541.1.p1 GENE.GHUV01000541.1~~GHUV01000541.1.p1  ORF type:complete len:413 (+),score=60.34 GHUV01000541.1:305-1543(+)